MNRRIAGQTAAGLVAVVAFAGAGWAAWESAIPRIRVYDGFWMILGATVTVLLVTPLIWSWPRERSLVAIAVACVVGSLAPLVVSALRFQIPIKARLRGSWIVGGADVVGPALVIGFVCLWFAVRKHGAAGRPERPK